MRDVLFNDDTLAFSKLAAGWLLRFDSRMRVKGFARNLYTAIKKINGEADADDINEILLENRIIPDGYVIDQKTQTVYVFEIEDTNPLTMNKLRKLAQIWFYLDCVYWDLKLLVIDRYLTCWRSLPLDHFYFSLVFPDPRKNKTPFLTEQKSMKIDWDATHRAASRKAINWPVVR